MLNYAGAGFKPAPAKVIINNMPMQSKFSEVFADVTKIDENKIEPLSNKLNDLETELDGAANKVRDNLRESHSRFEVELKDSQVREIMERCFGNLKSGL